jgi:DNA-binding NarL/FixJ family response regulator
MEKISVLIADDHRLFRMGLCQAIEEADGFQVVGEARNGQEAVEMANRLQPNIILMDINMPIMDGVQATLAILEKSGHPRIIILTIYQKDHYIFEAIKAGARGYLLKDIDEQELIEKVRAVHRGDVIINPSLASRLIDEFRRLSQTDGRPEISEPLTPGEMKVLRLVAQGMENREIAKTLSLSQRTVTNRLSEVYQKLHVNNRTQAALEALRRGWATLDGAE